MGEVYRALDTRLGREVAIKVLPASVARDPERLARFKREARTLAALNHPNIATIFGVEDEALVMELIEGDTVFERIERGAICVEDSLRIALEVASALEYAHQRGVIHRDLKPANVKAAERVKVLDFGLAKIQEVAGAGDATITGATQAGMIMGTAAYMSPEQASGRPVDSRSDIFSFGVLLYEMLSGRRAFSEDTAISTIGAILYKEPQPLHEIAPQVPPELDAVVTRCMAKKPAERFQSMPEVREALKKSLTRPAAAAEKEGPSLAVLPFANLSADKENEYFSDGLAEEILIALSQVKGLRVAARSSAFSFKGKQADPGEIAAKLNVGHVLDGSVRRSGNRVRVTVQLVDARRCIPLWSERYDRQMEDIFEVQDEIARAIAAQLQVALGAGGVKQATQSVEAYELYLKGRHYFNQRLASTMRLAMQCFEQAIKEDPSFALPYAGLADCYAILRVYGFIRHEEGQGPALAAVNKAKSLEPNSWEVIVSEGLYYFYFGDWQASGAHFERALQINPRSSLAQGYFAIYLAMARKRDDAISHAHTSYRMDPLNPFAHALAACTFQILGEPAAGIPLTEKALELQPDFLFGLWMKGLLLTELNRPEQALPTLEKVVGISRAPIFVALLAMSYGRAGRKEEVLRLLRELDERRERGEFVSAWSPAGAMIELGDLDGVRKALQEARAESNPAFGIRLLTTHKLDEYRRDLEIDGILKQFFGY